MIREPVTLAKSTGLLRGVEGKSLIPARRGKFILVLEQRPRGQWEYSLHWLHACVHSHAMRVVERDSMRNFKFSTHCSFYFWFCLSNSLSNHEDGFSVTFQQRFCHCVFSSYLHPFFPIPFSPCVKLDFTLGFRNVCITHTFCITYLFIFFFFFLLSKPFQTPFSIAFYYCRVVTYIGAYHLFSILRKF